jgi:hypothetical protein
MKDSAGLLSFPSPYSLKIIGNNTNEFHAAVRVIIEKYVAEGEEVGYFVRSSSGKKYMSVTATFTARSREQLEGVYQELNRNELVLITL